MNVAEIRAKFPQYKDLSDDQLIIGLHKKYYSDIPLNEFTKQIQYTAPDPTGSFGENALAGAGKAVNDLYMGGKQALTNLGIGNKQDVQSQIDEQARLDKPLMSTGGGVVGNIAGDAAMWAIPGLNAAKLAGPGLLARYGAAGGMGAAQGASTPTPTGGSTAVNAGAGAVGGLLGQGLGDTAGFLLNPIKSKATQPKLDLAKQAEDLGYTITPANKTESRVLGNVEGAFESLPFTAGKMESIKRGNVDTTNKLGLPTIGKTDEPYATQEVLAQAKQDIGKKFEDVTKGQDINLDSGFYDAIKAQKKKYESLPPALRTDAVENIFNDFLGSGSTPNPALSGLSPRAKTQAVSQGIPEFVGGKSPFFKGSISGDSFQGVLSRLSQASNDAFKNGHSDVGQALSALEDELLGAGKRGLPPGLSKAYEEARSQWRSLKVLTTPGVTSPTGDINASKLGDVVRRKDPQAYMFGKGETLLADVGRIGQTFKNMVPNSGTAERTQWMRILTNPASLSGAGLAGVGGGAGYYQGGPEGAAIGAGVGLGGPKAIQALMFSPMGQKWLTEGLLQNSGFNPAASAATKAALTRSILDLIRQEPEKPPPQAIGGVRG